MNYEEMANRLGSLVTMDVDAARAYDQALEEIDLENVREQILKFQEDHNRHIVELSAMINELGGPPPSIEPDAKGFAIERFTAIRSLSGTEGALKALQMNEKITGKTYSEARSWELTPGAAAIVERNYRDEQQHLRHIREMLADRVWEQGVWLKAEEGLPRATQRRQGMH